MASAVHEGRPKRSRKPNLFYQPKTEEIDDELKAAIKKSRLEVKHKEIDYVNDLPEVPTVHPTMEVFSDPQLLYKTYGHLGEKFGAIKIVPPEEWKPPFDLKLENIKFQVRVQHIDKLSIGKPFVHPEDIWNSDDLHTQNQKFLKERFSIESPSIEEIEKEYWKIVDTATEPVSVLYAADLKTNQYGSGFPSDPSNPYTHHPFNLLNLAKSEGSLLKYLHTDVPGVTSPWLYFGMIFSSFCWHTEDNFFSAVNYHHFGAPKMWYIVHPSRSNSVEKLLKNYVANKDTHYALHSLTVQLSPSLLRNNNIPVYRAVQGPNEFMLLWPRTFHAGFNAGLNCNEACNYAPPSWLEIGYRSISSYRYLRSTCIPFFQLVLLCAQGYLEFNKQCLFYLCKAILQLFDDEFQARKTMAIKHLPLHFAKKNVQKVKENSSKVLNDLVTHTSDLLHITPTPLDHSTPTHTLLEQCVGVSKLPSKDCDNCQTACFTGCVICPHIKDVFCSQCSELHTCNCSSKVYLYRFPITVLMKICQTLLSQFEKLEGEEELEKQLKEHTLYKQFPPNLDDLISYEMDAIHTPVNTSRFTKKRIKSMNTPSKKKHTHTSTKDSTHSPITHSVHTPESTTYTGSPYTPSNTTSEYDTHTHTPLSDSSYTQDIHTNTHTHTHIHTHTHTHTEHYDLAKKLSWKYIHITVKAEQEDDDDKYLPSIVDIDQSVKVV